MVIDKMVSMKHYHKSELYLGKGKATKILIPKEWRSEGDIYLSTVGGSAEKELRRLGYSPRKWYVRFRLDRDPENLPKCPICGKVLNFRGFTKGFDQYCSLECAYKSDERKSKCRKTTINRFNDPNFVKRWRSSFEEKYQEFLNDEVRYNKAKSKHLIGISTKSYRKAQSIAAFEHFKRLWKDPDSLFNSNNYRINNRNRMLKLWNDPNSIFNSKKYKDKRSRLFEYIWAHPEEYKYFHKIQEELKSSGGAIGIMRANQAKYKLPSSPQYKRGIAKSNKCDYPIYASSYELQWIKLLNKDPQVARFKMQPLSINYDRGNNDIHKYYPDCLVEYIDGSMLLVEIKPEVLSHSWINQRKFEAGESYAKSQGWKWAVITEQELWS